MYGRRYNIIMLSGIFLFQEEVSHIFLAFCSIWSQKQYQFHILKEIKDFYFLFARIIMGTEDMNLLYCFMLLI